MLRTILLGITIVALTGYARMSAAAGTSWGTPPRGSHILADTTVKRMLVKPACLAGYHDTVRNYTIENVAVPSGDIILSGQLYLPPGPGPWPLVILTHGGFNETELIMAAPRYYAPRLAHCGAAAFVYFKRGTGASGGVYADASDDDFINDIGSVARLLAQRPDIDTARIGVLGGSGGGLNGPVAAARFPEIRFVVSTSGPIVSFPEEADYNIEHAHRARGYPDSLIQRVMPLWRRHHAALGRADTAALRVMAGEIAQLRKTYDMFLLPTPYNEVFADSGLSFLWPRFRSAGRNFIGELSRLRAKCLFIYGENDRIVPVASSLRNIDSLLCRAGNGNYSIIVLPGADHSFFMAGSREQVHVIRTIVNWMREQGIIIDHR